MKKIFLSFILLLSMSIGAIAQTKVVCNACPIGLDWKFKRSFMNGTSLVVDFVVENNTGKDITCQVMVGATCELGTLELKAYDDEGNVYNSCALNPSLNKFQGKIGGKNSLFDEEIIPQGNLVKVRMQIADIDEFSTLIKTLIIPYRSWANGGAGFNPTYSELRVSNIPIPRE